MIPDNPSAADALFKACEVVPIYIIPAIGAKVEEREVPFTVGILVISKFVNHPLVTLLVVSAMDPVMVKLPVPRAKVGLLMVVVPATDEPMLILVVEPAAPPVPRLTVLVLPFPVALVE